MPLDDAQQRLVQSKSAAFRWVHPSRLLRNRELPSWEDGSNAMLSLRKARFESGRAPGYADALRVVGEFERGLGGKVGDRGAIKKYNSKQISILSPFPKLTHSGRVPSTHNAADTVLE